MSKVYNPYPYQQYCHERIIDTPAIGLFLDMGLGKTVITLTALHDLKYNRFCIRKALVIAPKKVAEDTWINEASKWEHLKDMRISCVMGTATQRMNALAAVADVYVINRDNTKWLVDLYGHNWPFDVVVLDESSSFKNSKSQRFRALKAVRPKISRVIELSGTPSPNGLTDLWAQIYLLDSGKRLGRTISVYRDLFFVPDKRSRTKIFSYAPREGAEKQIHELIGDICISMKSEDYLTLPDRIYEDIPVVLDSKAQKAYEDFQNNAVLQFEQQAFMEAAEKINCPTVIRYHFSKDIPRIGEALVALGIPVVDGRQFMNADDTEKCVCLLHDEIPMVGSYPEIPYDLVVTAGSAGALDGKLLQLCNGAVYAEDGTVVPVHDCKIEVFMEMLEQLGGQHTLVFYHFQHDRDRILTALENSGLRVRVYSGPADSAAWNAGEIDVLLAHPASCGYGLNLQEGGHHVIWFGLTWALEEYQQANKRLHRQGQEHPVIIHHLVTKGGRDEDVMAALSQKADSQEYLLQSLKAKIQSVKETMA